MRKPRHSTLIALQNQATLAVMFVHVADTTQLYAKLGDEAARLHIDAALGECRGAAAEQHGQIVKSLGTALLITFGEGGAAASAAAQMHRLLDKHRARFNRLRLKIGVCAGPVVQEKDDIFGDTVNVAARMADLAVAEQTLVPASLRDTLKHPQRGLARGLGRFAVKGKSEPIEVIELLWRDSLEMTQMTRAYAAADPVARQAQLAVRYHGHEWRLSAIKPRLTLGRSPDCDVIVSDPQASRLHARLELRNDKFVLIDQSTNGTLIKVGNSPELQVHREEVYLQGDGTIRFGRPEQAEAEEFVSFGATG